MRPLALAVLVLAALAPPAPALADNCEHRQERAPALPSLEGVTTVRFEVNSHDLDLRGVTGEAASLAVVACVSDPAYFEQLVVEPRRVGDTLVIRMERHGASVGVFFRPTYANLRVTARLPSGLDYVVDVGSGDARVAAVARLRAEVGSGDLAIDQVPGVVRLAVGSGDIEASRIGSLRVDSVGSGDLVARDIEGDARVERIGSGDLALRGVGGNVEIGSVGSGDADVVDVAGDLQVDRIGSGDVDHRGVRGRTDLPGRR